MFLKYMQLQNTYIQNENSKTIIRPMALEDTANIVKWRNAPFVRENFLYREDMNEATHQKWVKEQVNTGRVKQFVIYSKELARDVGSVYLRDIDQDKKEAEYGIFIGEEAALGKGYGKEACVSMVKYARDELGLRRVFLRVFEDNIAAVKSYEGAGFSRICNSDITEYGRNMIFMEIVF